MFGEHKWDGIKLRLITQGIGQDLNPKIKCSAENWNGIKFHSLLFGQQLRNRNKYVFFLKLCQPLYIVYDYYCCCYHCFRFYYHSCYCLALSKKIPNHVRLAFIFLVVINYFISFEINHVLVPIYQNVSYQKKKQQIKTILFII